MSRFPIIASAALTVAQQAEVTAQEIANKWPQLTMETAREFVRVGRGLPINNAGKFIQVQSNLYHAVQFPAAGTTELQFFNTNASPFICNLQGNFLPPERPMWLTGVRFKVLDANISSGVIKAIQDADTDETPLATSTAGTTATGGTDNVNAAGRPLDRALRKRSMIELGLVQVSIADLPIINALGLDRFPAGAGVDFEGMAAFGGGVTASTNTQVGAAIANLQNGAPFFSNQNVFRGPIPWLPGQQIDFRVKWPYALTIPAITSGIGGAVIVAELVGETVIARQG